MKFLADQQARLHNFISSTASDEFYEKHVDFASIPAIYVYGPDGTLAKRFDNDQGEYGAEGFTYEQHIVPFVEGLLGGEEGE